MAGILVTVEDYTPKSGASMYEPVIEAALSLEDGKVVSFGVPDAEVATVKRYLRELAGKHDRTARVDTFPDADGEGNTVLKVWLVGKVSRPRKPKDESATPAAKPAKPTK